MNKAFRLTADDIKPLALARGAGIATDMITCMGHKVGFMYREEPLSDADSGWRFMAGTESEEYMENLENSGFYDINTIANYDPDIIDCLDAPIGAAFERLDNGAFVSVELDSLGD